MSARIGTLLPLIALSLVAGCGEEGAPSVPARNEAAAPAKAAPPAPAQVNEPVTEAAPGNRTQAAEPPVPPGVAQMSPYRRREYERGYRDCRRGAFDRERQGESYRIGCMAAQEAGEAGR